MRSTGRAGETGSGVTWNTGNYQSTGTEDNVAKVTGDGGFLTFKNSGKTRVYVTTNSPGYYTCREVSVLNDEITESGIQITVENIYGTKTYGITPAYKSKPAGMQTEVPEYAFMENQTAQGKQKPCPEKHYGSRTYAYPGVFAELLLLRMPVKFTTADLTIDAIAAIPNTEIFGTGTYRNVQLGIQ